jgi:siroheme synthase (precorrin-2 oxidase/ferrochelatase)
MADSRRATVYFDPAIHKALRLKAAATDRAVSEIVNDALRRAFAEDAADLAAARKRRREKPVSFETVVKSMRRRGQV